MKKLLSGSYLLFFFVFILFQACKKDVNLPNSNNQNLTVAEAKEFFNKNFRSAHVHTDKSVNDLGQINTIQDIYERKQALWDKAYTKRISQGTAVKIPLDLGNSYLKVGATDRIPFNSLNYLLMYRDSSKNIHAEVVLLFPDTAWLYGQRSTFTGEIIVKGWNGRFIKKFIYTKSGTVSIITRADLQRNQSKATEATSAPIPICLLFPTGKCTCRDKNNCDMCLAQCAQWICGTTIESEIPEDPTIPPGTGGGTGLPPAPGDGQGGSGTGGGDYIPPNCNPDPNYTIPTTPPPPGQQWMIPCGGETGIPIPSKPDLEFTPWNITNNISTPCLNKSLNEVLIKGVNGTISRKMKQLYNSNSDANLIFIDGFSLPEKTDGDAGAPLVTRGISKDGKEWVVIDCTIRLNNNTLENSSKEYVAATVLHEGLHAIMRYEGQKDIYDHFEMALSYVNILANGIREIYPNISANDAVDLAWGGLHESASWLQLKRTNPGLASRIESTNYYYKKKVSGTPTCN